MIRDRIVVDLVDANLSMKLQMDPKLMLEKVTTAARQTEAVKKQQDVVRSDYKLSTVDAINSQKHGETHKKPIREQFKYKHSSSQAPPTQTHNHKQACSRCGKIPSHRKQDCPAREAVCHKCSKKGHFQSLCRSKKLDHLEAEFYDQFLGALEDQSTTTSPWEVTLTVNGVPILFKIDTGTDVSAISENIFKQLPDVTLTSMDSHLSGPSQHHLQVSGQFTAMLKHGPMEAQEIIFVVNSLQRSILGRPGIEALNLVSRLDIVAADRKFIAMHPQLFTGLGTMPGEYHISLRDGAKPFGTSSPRRVPLPLMPKVPQELERMEAQGVISKVEQPTDWCAGIVVVPKPNGNLRICVNLTKLNKNVRRERHILPSVDHTLAQLTGATIFTKLDANAGFWQIKLTEESSFYTTFITPFRTFHFNRLPFGITSAPEFFQWSMTTILADLPGVVCMMDDVLVHGSSVEEHDH